MGLIKLCYFQIDERSKALLGLRERSKKLSDYTLTPRISSSLVFHSKYSSKGQKRENNFTWEEGIAFDLW